MLEGWAAFPGQAGKMSQQEPHKIQQRQMLSAALGMKSPGHQDRLGLPNWGAALQQDEHVYECASAPALLF